VLDIARFAENAWFVRQREDGWADSTLGDIVHALLGEADAVLMSAKNDAIANIGSFVAIREDEEFFQGLQARGIVFEGFPTYGGLAGRDLEAIAVGLREVPDEDYLRAPRRAGRLPRHRAGRGGRGAPRAVRGPRGLPRRGRDAASPGGGRVPYPGARVCALYLAGAMLAGAVRGVEIGSVMAGRDPVTGEDRHPRLELVRLAVPRRVYTSRQLEPAADAAAEVLEEAAAVRGVRIVSEAPALRHFTARFEPA